MGSSSHMKRKWAIQANLEYTISFSLVYILHYASWNCQPWNAGIRWLAPPKNGTEKNIERRTLRSNEKKNLLPARHIPQAITTTKQINRNQLKFQCVLNAMEWKHRKWKQIVVVIKNYEKKTSTADGMICSVSCGAISCYLTLFDAAMHGVCDCASKFVWSTRAFARAPKHNTITNSSCGVWICRVLVERK